jgi:poly-gamma-glutamate biosynthesis protein PgsC/CapC
MNVDVLFIGIVVSLIVSEVAGLSPGGIIVPGYIALFFTSPLRIAGTYAAAMATFGAYRLLSRRLILFGRRRFAAMILIGAFFAWSSMALIPRLSQGAADLRVVSWVVPGLLANSFDQQKFLPTAILSIAAGAAVFALARILAAI